MARVVGTSKICCQTSDLMRIFNKGIWGRHTSGVSRADLQVESR